MDTLGIKILDYLVIVDLLIKYETVEEWLATIFLGSKSVKCWVKLLILDRNFLWKDELSVFFILFRISKHREKYFSGWVFSDVIGIDNDNNLVPFEGSSMDYKSSCTDLVLCLVDMQTDKVVVCLQTVVHHSCFLNLRKQHKFAI